MGDRGAHPCLAPSGARTRLLALAALLAPAEAPIQTSVVEVLADGRVATADAAPARLIGVDGRGADLAAALRELLPAGTLVRLERDATPADADGTPAVYAFRGDELVNETLLRSGKARLAVEFVHRRHAARLAAAAESALGEAPRLRGPPAPRAAGVALPLYGDTPDFDYRSRIDEIRALGANAISLMPFYFLENIDAVVIEAVPGRTPSDANIVATGNYAREQGLAVTLLPVVHIRKPGPRDWRGAYEPAGERLDVFFQHYGRFITAQADLARELRADSLAVGSELLRLERHADRWRALIEACRARFRGRLTYSANWDQYRPIAFWDALDYVGLTGYYTLATVRDPTRGDLRAGWRVPKRRLLQFLDSIDRTAVFTELGYPSRDGCAEKPWDYVTVTPYDGAEQADCLASFFDEFAAEPRISGVFIYDWFDAGGAGDRHYTPRGKPAEEVVRGGLARVLRTGDR